MINGQVIRSIHDRVIWMTAREGDEVASGQQRWDVAKLGKVLGTDVFRVATPGLRSGSGRSPQPVALRYASDSERPSRSIVFWRGGVHNRHRSR